MRGGGMRWFQRREAKVLAAIKDIKEQIARIEAKRDVVNEELKLSTDIVRLKRELTNLEIERDRDKEKHEREKREVQHMVGLEKKRQEFEIDSAKRDTTLTIREENLAADRDRFEEQMQFMTKRFDSEVKYLKELMGEVLDRLPTTKALISVGGRNGDPNGDELD